jgi:peptide/nickel transport system ATP-binding protein
MSQLLQIHDLSVTFGQGEAKSHAVRGLNLSLNSGEIVALVGESGCGSSLTALTVMRLNPPSSHATGNILFDGVELLQAPEKQIRSLRGREIGMVFQEPMTSLNPAFTIGDQIAEPLRLHLKLSRKDARDRVIELLARVRIAAPQQRANSYPHQLSGGMRQRVMIAIALSCSPRLLILDEPTTALDVTTQAQVLEIIEDLRSEFNTAMLLITHDLGVVAEVSDRVVVMYAGSPVEGTSVNELFAQPSHPYTNGLLGALPHRTHGARERLVEIPGSVPIVRGTPTSCLFAERCSIASEQCWTQEPHLSEILPDHFVACFHPQNTTQTDPSALALSSTPTSGEPGESIEQGTS